MWKKTNKTATRPKVKSKKARKPQGPNILPIFKTVLGLDDELQKTMAEEQEEFKRKIDAKQKPFWDEVVYTVLHMLIDDYEWQKELKRRRYWRMEELEELDEERDERLLFDRLSMEDLNAERDELRRKGYETGELLWKKGETREQWVERADGTNERMAELWWENEEGIRERAPRYLEGFPVRYMLSCPMVSKRRKYMPTGRPPCIQCSVKGLPCSLTTEFEGVHSKGACARCIRSGERHECMWRSAPNIWQAPELKERIEGQRVSEEVTRKMEAICWEWVELKKRVVVEVIGNRMQKVTTSAFVLPRPEKWLRRERWE